MKLANTIWILPIFLFFACRQSPTSDTTNSNQKVSTTEPKQDLIPVNELYGSLLHDVQMAQVFPDGKTFVDCTPKESVELIRKAYETEKSAPNFDLSTFIHQHFDLPKKYASGFKADISRSPEEHINILWPILTREADQTDLGTLIPLPKPYIVPGGRFGEIYYWDSYFTILGLQAAGEYDMIENMVDNFSYLIDNVGFIPNGNRTYFLGRSQPPFYSLMVGVLAEIKGEAVLKKYLPQLEKEYAFWMEGMSTLTPTNRTHRRLVRLGDGTILNRYWDDFAKPRPESYREDVLTKEESGRTAEDIYRNLRAACESGWDFSSRWLEDAKNLKTIRTTEILPVDLNCLLYNLEWTIARAHQIDNNEEKYQFYTQRAEQRKAGIESYNWYGQAGYYLDFFFPNGEPTFIPSLAGVFPLFFNVATREQALLVAQTIEEDFLRAGGVVTTPHHTGQQWDAPNGWAPLQWMTIKGLRNYGHDELADKIKQRWIDLCVKVYQNTGKMVEKYNVMDITLEAGGGEYPVQDGFGWTNGILLKILTEEK